MLTKIMTFNLRQNVESDGENAWPNRVKAAAEVIKIHDVDLIGIQEGLYDMLLDLELMLPEYAWIGEGREGGNKGEFNAILYKKSKWNVGDAGHFSLSEKPEELGSMSWNSSHPRMCTWAIFRSITGEQLIAFNTHLDHISEEAQKKGMELIRQKIEQFRETIGLSTVLTGDFNVYPDHSVVEELEREGYLNAYSVFREEGASVGITCHHFQGGEAGKPIDYIFVSSDLLINSVLVDRKQYEGRYPSDHYPVIAEISHE